MLFVTYRMSVKGSLPFHMPRGSLTTIGSGATPTQFLHGILGTRRRNIILKTVVNRFRLHYFRAGGIFLAGLFPQ